MKLARIFGLLFLFAFGVTIMLTQFVVEQGKGAIRLEISSGEGVADIADSLKRHGVIRSATAFRLYLKSQNLDTSIRSGVHIIEPGMSYSDIANLLSTGSKEEMRITIPEGFTVAQIDDLLAEKGLIEGDDLLDCAKSRPAPRSSAQPSEVGCDFSPFDFLPSTVAQSPGGMLEGYLFPDTYFVNPSEFVAKFFLERQLSTFKTKIIGELSEDLSATDRSLEDIIIMASIIERETRTSEERPIVSGILWKRFDQNRGLDADATIRYGLNKLTGPLTKSDLEDRSNLYNTRRHAGLPPGPISNPGLASIRAALYPEETEYWYYLHGSDGQIHYSKTNEEHNVKKAKYL